MVNAEYPIPTRKGHICRLFGDGALSSAAATDRLSTASKPHQSNVGDSLTFLRPSRKKKEGLASVTLRWIVCSSDAASQAYDPSVSSVRSWSVWHGERSRRKKMNKEARRNYGGGKISCALSTEIPVVGTRLPDGSEQSPSYCRRENHQDTLSNPDAPLLRHDLAPSEPLHCLPGHEYHPTSSRLEETSVLLGRINSYDQYYNHWLYVDNMSYEELLELGDQIGYVNTGLKEEEILSILRKVKYSFLDALKRHILPDTEWKWIICQI